jgi:hypothetical protein
LNARRRRVERQIARRSLHAKVTIAGGPRISVQMRQRPQHARPLAAPDRPAECRFELETHCCAFVVTSRPQRRLTVAKFPVPNSPHAEAFIALHFQSARGRLAGVVRGDCRPLLSGEAAQVISMQVISIPAFENERFENEL